MDLRMRWLVWPGWDRLSVLVTGGKARGSGVPREPHWSLQRVEWGPKYSKLKKDILFKISSWNAPLFIQNLYGFSMGETDPLHAKKLLRICQNWN